MTCDISEEQIRVMEFKKDLQTVRQLISIWTGPCNANVSNR
jgi:hypothetical protein